MITLLVASECQIGLGVRICQYVELQRSLRPLSFRAQIWPCDSSKITFTRKESALRGISIITRNPFLQGKSVSSCVYEVFGLLYCFCASTLMSRICTLSRNPCPRSESVSPCLLEAICTSRTFSALGGLQKLDRCGRQIHG